MILYTLLRSVENLTPSAAHKMRIEACSALNFAALTLVKRL